MSGIIEFLQNKKTYILAAILGVLNLGVIVGVIGEDQVVAIHEDAVFIIDAILSILVVFARRATSMRAAEGKVV